MEISFSKDSFMISDNCGGIPWSLHDYAFRMGRASDRPSHVPGGVGVYGIGMKRAIFKMGEHCLVSTQNADNRYEVEVQAGVDSRRTRVDGSRPSHKQSTEARRNYDCRGKSLLRHCKALRRRCKVFQVATRPDGCHPLCFSSSTKVSKSKSTVMSQAPSDAARLYEKNRANQVTWHPAFYF